MDFISNQFNKEQLEAIRHFDGPMLVLAGPGSGKTRVLTERVKYLIEERRVKPEDILVISFSQKSAREMQERFIKIADNKSYPVNFGTFHAVFFHILSHYHKYSRESIIVDKEKYKIIEECGKKIKNTKYYTKSWQIDMADYISAYKNIGNEFFDTIGAIMDESEREEFVCLYKEYIRRCKLEGKLDFDDMIIECLNLLKSNNSILSKWQNIYKYICVDEFQDINNSQYEVLALLAGDNHNVFVVGDDDQSIYAFRGARPELMQRFLSDYSDCKQVYLKINYRCDANIIYAANELITNNSNRILRTAQCPNSPHDGEVCIVEAENTIIQAEYICETIKKLKIENGYSYSDFACLYRSGFAGKMLADVLEKHNIPVKGYSDSSSITDKPEMQIVISYMKIAIGKADKQDYLYVINNPTRHISREAIMYDEKNILNSISIYYEDDCDMKIIVDKLIEDIIFIGKLSPYAAYIYMLKSVNLKEYYINVLKMSFEAYKEAVISISHFVKDFSSIESLIEYVNVKDNEKTSGRNITQTYNDGINVMTVHASKGLEFEVVFVLGLQEGQFPHKKNLHAQSVEEERRLMYVAMTRARKKLYLMALCVEHGKLRSRFIDEILHNQSFISSYSSLSRNSSKASATASYSSSSSMYMSSGSTLGSDSSSLYP